MVIGWPHCLVALLLAAVAARPATVDRLRFGEPASEQAHQLVADGSEVFVGGLGEPARRLLPREPANWQGGRLSFVLRVSPDARTYATARFWGDDVTVDRLLLFAEGKQIGYRHLGDIEQLDYGSAEPAVNERFFYVTTPLPESLTRGRDQVHLEIRASGRLAAYASTFEQYQKVMTEPTRGIYGIATHTDGWYEPDPADRQGQAPVAPSVRQSPGPEVLETLTERVSRTVRGLLSRDRPMGQMEMQFLARAYHVPWTPAYLNPQVIEQELRSLDAFIAAYRENPSLARSEPSTWNADWFGFGPLGDVIRLLAEPLASRMDEPVAGGGTRRSALVDLLVASRDWHLRHRRMYTNQSMIIDLNSYLANRGAAILDPARALPEERIRTYLYQSVGLLPWLGSDTDDGPERPVGNDYCQITAEGLTRELGYVGYYGEVLDWVERLYDATRPGWGEPGDARLLAQLERMARARTWFRYPALDDQGHRAMRIETIVGWRDSAHPGDVTYGQRSSWDGVPLQAAAALLTPEAVGVAQQMFADNQFFATIQRQLREPGFRVTAAVLEVPEQYQRIRAQPASPTRLPMSSGQPDSVFSDEENGVLAVKHGEVILYVSLYWRARYAINHLARVHLVSPRLSRLAVVQQETEFEPSGLTYTRPDWTNFGFGAWGPRYPGEFHSAHAGETLPIAGVPEGVAYKPGDENLYAGRGRFYRLRYGPYLIGMNLTTDQTYELPVPKEAKRALRLPDRRPATPGQPLAVRPRSTVVLLIGG